MPASALSLGAWLDALRGEVPLNALAQATGFSRHQLGRWSRGVARTTLPEFLLLVQVCSGRLDQLLSNLLPPPTGPRLDELRERRHTLWRRLREKKNRGPALRS
jgi:hypothetical protein